MSPEPHAIVVAEILAVGRGRAGQIVAAVRRGEDETVAQGVFEQGPYLRASAGLVLAGLAAAGDTDVKRVYHLDRANDSGAIATGYHDS